MSIDPEVLRQTIVEGCDRIVHAPRILVNNTQRAMAQAQMRFWQSAITEELTRLASFLPPTIAAEATEPIEATPEATAAAQSMRDRASKVALQHAMIPCAWCAQAISRDIDDLPLIAP